MVTAKEIEDYINIVILQMGDDCENHEKQIECLRWARDILLCWKVD